MSEVPEVGLWSKFDTEVWREIQEKTAASLREKQKEPEKAKKRSRRISVLNAVAVAVWTYFPVKIFVADVDRWIAQTIAPGYTWLLDFRVAFSLLAVTAFVLAFRRRQWWMLPYVLGWPLIALFWYLPRFLYKRGSWTLTIGVVHACIGLFRGVRSALVAVTVTVVAFLAIVLGDVPWVMYVAASALLIVFLGSLVRTFRYAVSPDRFVRSQRSMVEAVLNSTRFWKTVSVDDSLRDDQVEKFNSEQVQKIVTSASLGLMACRGSQFWASKLDEYRRSPASVIFGAMAVLGLFIQAVFTFTLVNFAIYKVDPTQFAADQKPSFAIFVYYAFAAALGSEIAVLAPVGSTAALAHVAAGFSTAVVLLVLVLALVFGIKQSRFDQSSLDAIQRMRALASSFEARLGREYETTPQNLVERVMALSTAFAGVLAYLSKGMPDFDGEPRS